MCFTINYILIVWGSILKVGSLPRKGSKTITVTDAIHQDIKKRAEETNLTMKEYVEYLLSKDATKDSKN